MNEQFTSFKLLNKAEEMSDSIDQNVSNKKSNVISCAFLQQGKPKLLISEGIPVYYFSSKEKNYMDFIFRTGFTSSSQPLKMYLY